MCNNLANIVHMVCIGGRLYKDACQRLDGATGRRVSIVM